jgi:hypothetical protein
MGEKLVQNLLPALLLVDPDAKLSLLRSEAFANEKNTRMMTILSQQEWWAQYMDELEQRRRKGHGPWPEHPSELVEEVETYVDSVMRSLHPGYVR